MNDHGDERDPVSALVHGLRTPLAVVSGFAELLDRRGEDLSAEQRAEYVARILQAAREMDAILQSARD
jgi:signal transduction histidine kinase